LSGNKPVAAQALVIFLFENALSLAGLYRRLLTDYVYTSSE
jgi:hypothetical protein